jgi:hypothetical protein
MGVRYKWKGAFGLGKHFVAITNHNSFWPALMVMFKCLKWPKRGESVKMERVVGHVLLSKGICAYQHIEDPTLRAEKLSHRFGQGQNPWVDFDSNVKRLKVRGLF